jgi:hypothetical protein
MAWMNQEKKAVIAAELKKVMPKDWKYSLKVHHHSSLTLTISAAPVDLIAQHKKSDYFTGKETHVELNEYHLQHSYDEPLLSTFLAIRKALNTGNYDRSDIQTDYFCVGFYAYIHIGKWDKPFQVIPQRKEPTLEELKTRLAELEERAAQTV